MENRSHLSSLIRIPPSAADMLHGRRAAADLSCNYVNGIGYEEFAYLVDLFFGPRTPHRLLLHASVDEDHAVSPRAPRNLLQFLYEWFNFQEVQGARLECERVCL
jgi:hypothetical protein